MPAGFVVRAPGWTAPAGRSHTVPRARAMIARCVLSDGALDGTMGAAVSVELSSVSEPFTVVVKPDGRAHVFGDTTQAVLDAMGRSILDSTEPSVSWPGNQPGTIDTAADGPGDTVLVAGRSDADDPSSCGSARTAGPTHASVSADSPSSQARGLSLADDSGPARAAAGGRDDEPPRARAAPDGTRAARHRLRRHRTARIAPPRGLKGWDAHYLALDAHERILVAGSGWTKDQDVGALPARDRATEGRLGRNDGDLRLLAARAGRHSIRRLNARYRPGSPWLVLVREPDQLGVERKHRQLAFGVRFVELAEPDRHVAADDDRTPAGLDDDHLHAARVARRRDESEPGKQLDARRRPARTARRARRPTREV